MAEFNDIDDSFGDLVKNLGDHQDSPEIKPPEPEGGFYEATGTNEPPPEPDQDKKPVEKPADTPVDVPKEPVIPDGHVILKKEEAEELQFLRTVVSKFESDFEAAAKEYLGRDLSTPQKSYDQKYEEGIEAIRKEFGDDFEPVSADMTNARSDTGKYLKKIAEFQHKLLQEQEALSRGGESRIATEKQQFVAGRAAIESTVRKATSEYGVEQQKLQPIFDELAKISNDKFLLAEAALRYYIKAEFGLQSKVLKQKIEEKIAAEAAEKLTPSPTSEKSQNRSDTYKPSTWSDEPMFTF